jgi:hypothetical protein
MLHDLLSRKRSSIVEKWFELILDTYPEDTSKFLRRSKDPFANPVRSTILQGIEGVLGEILKDHESPDALNDFLDRVIRIRSVQDFSPSQSLAFVFSLKTVIRQVLAKEIQEHGLHDQLQGLESRVDCLALRAFDVYMACREAVYELRVGEIKRQREAAFRALERSNRSIEKRMQKEEPLSRDSE